MNKTFTLLLLLLSSFAFSQSNKFVYKNKEFVLDSRVVDYLGDEKVSEYKEKAPYKLLQYNFLVNNSCKVISSLPDKKNIKVQTKNFSSTEITDFNILTENIELTENNQYFMFGSQYLMVFSQNSFNYNFNKFLNSINQ